MFLQNSLIRRIKGDTLSLLVQNFYLSPGYLVLSLLLPYYFLDYLGWLLLDQPFIFYFFSLFYPSLPGFPRGVYNSCFEGFKDWGGRGCDDFVPEEVTKRAPSGDETT